MIGDDLGNAQQIGGGVTGLVIGIVGGLYGGLGVALACQNAMNTVWSVPRNMRPDPIRGRLQGLLLLGTIGLAILGTTAVSNIGGALHLGGSFSFLLTLAVVVLNAGIFIVAFRLTCARPLSVADVAPGAIAAAVLWQALQSFGALYVTSVVRGASTTNGVFAIVLGLLAFLFLAAARSSCVRKSTSCESTNSIRGRCWLRSPTTPNSSKAIGAPSPIKQKHNARFPTRTSM